MSDQPEKPVAPKPSNVPKPSTVPAGAAAPEPPLSPVKILKDWFRSRKPSSKNKDVLKTVKSHQFVLQNLYIIKSSIVNMLYALYTSNKYASNKLM